MFILDWIIHERRARCFRGDDSLAWRTEEKYEIRAGMTPPFSPSTEHLMFVLQLYNADFKREPHNLTTIYLKPTHLASLNVVLMNKNYTKKNVKTDQHIMFRTLF